MRKQAPGTLAVFVQEYGLLTPGHVVTVGVQVARELAALHAAGHVYANVSAETIELAGDGRPSLAAANGGGGQPADDVRALVDVLRAVAGPNAGLTLLRVLGASSDAATLARDLYAVCAPEPLLATGDSSVSHDRFPRIRLVVALALVVVLAGLGGVAWAHSSSHRATADVPPPLVTTSVPVRPSVHAAAPTDWRQVLTRIDADRDAAFGRGDATLLSRVYVRGSAPDVTDRAALHALVVQHVHARGLRLVIESVRVAAATPTSAALTVVDRLAAYDVVDEHNRPVAHRPARTSHAWRIRLVLTSTGWRIASID